MATPEQTAREIDVKHSLWMTHWQNNTDSHGEENLEAIFPQFFEDEQYRHDETATSTSFR
jgi:hypothetical protein